MTSPGAATSSTRASSISSVLQFSPLPSVVSPDFWHSLATLKLDRLRLDDAPVPLTASYSLAKQVKDRTTNKDIAIHGGLTLDSDSLALAQFGEDNGSTSTLSNRSHTTLVVPVSGSLVNYNTAAQFTSSDKNDIFNTLAQEILHDLVHSSDPLTAVTRFTLLTFADLKKYKFYHWAASPALVCRPSWHLTSGAWVSLREQESSWYGLPRALTGWFDRYNGSHDSGFCLAKPDSSGNSVELGRIVDYDTFFVDIPEADRTVLFADPSSHATAPGWPLRNVLSLLLLRFKARTIRVICWRDELPKANETAPSSTDSLFASSKSLVGTVYLPEEGSEAQAAVLLKNESGEELPLAPATGQNSHTVPAAIGWERNAAGKLAPKVADLGPLMDPKRLADQAVDLNLKLMRWRIMPDIQLERIAGTKCLLLGAGTLGCYVARVLLGWGVRNITLVDNGRVSYSNPVRQPLFDFDDCVGGGEPKAECAADKLTKIFPGVHARGVSLSIPMPGHSLLGATGSHDSVKRDVEQLEKLYNEHDAVFLLMDSRESRWLPTLLGAAKDKIVINAALGFDTYLVMRHGASPGSASLNAPSTHPPSTTPVYDQSPNRLGCYFCNDVVAPTDSLTDRTLDQMCTVTRPGLAAVAGASAVELLVSLLHHKDSNKAAAPPPSSTSKTSASDQSSSGSPLGLLPHQIRGFLSSYSTTLVTGAAFDRCTACSSRVVDAYLKEGWEMLRRALGDASDEAQEVHGKYGYLERLTGLDELYRQTEKLLEEEGLVDEWSSDSADGDDE